MRRDFSEPPSALRDKPQESKSELLLYVEDDDDNWEVASYRLRDSYELVRAMNAEDACKVIRARHTEISVILMDIELRGSDLNGVELIQLLRGNAAQVTNCIPAYARNLPFVSKPVIYVTAHARQFTNVELLLTGAEKVLPKPIDFADLRTVLSELLAARKGRSLPWSVPP